MTNILDHSYIYSMLVIFTELAGVDTSYIRQAAANFAATTEEGMT
jgi:hypothetical protein